MLYKNVIILRVTNIREIYNSNNLCLLLLLVSLNIDPALFVLDLHMKYTVEVVTLRTYIVWVVIV